MHTDNRLEERDRSPLVGFPRDSIAITAQLQIRRDALHRCIGIWGLVLLMVFGYARSMVDSTPLVESASLAPITSGTGALIEPQKSSKLAQDQADRKVSPCQVRLDKTASPKRIPIGQRTRVSLTADPGCPDHSGPLDVVLVIDSSGSMQRENKLVMARRAATNFVEKSDMSNTRIGIISFSETALIESEMSQDADALRRVIANIPQRGGTNIVAAMKEAKKLVLDSRATRPWPADKKPIEVVIFLSDGRQDHLFGEDGRRLASEAAEDMKDATGAMLSTVCLGEDCDRFLMAHIASSKMLFFVSATAGELVDIYSEIGELLRKPRVSYMLIRDVIPDNMKFLPNTAEPMPDRIEGKTVFWEIEAVSKDPVVISYWLKPLELGAWPTNVEASNNFKDIYEREGQGVYPIPQVSVYGSVYLPIMIREQCEPEQRSTDVVLLLDTSSSMQNAARNGEMSKLGAARNAAMTFVEQMRLPSDRVAIVSFDAEARRIHEMSGNMASVTAAIASLQGGEGTRIDLGLKESLTLLAALPNEPARSKAIVLLTDGRPSTDDAKVLSAARTAREAGINVFTVGLGQDVNPELLRAVSGDSARYFAAPDAASLQDIYRRLALLVPCPGGRHDWSEPWP